MQSTLPETILPQFSSVALSNAVHLVPSKRCLPPPSSDSRPFQSSLPQFSSLSRNIGSRKRSAFDPILTDRNHRRPSSLSGTIQRMQIPCEKDEPELPFDDFDSLSSPRSGFFLFSPCCDDARSELSPREVMGNEGDSTALDAHLSGMRNKTESTIPRQSGPLTNPIRKPKIFLKPRFKHIAFF